MGLGKSKAYKHVHDYRYLRYHIDKSGGVVTAILYSTPDQAVEIEDVIVVITETLAGAVTDISLGIIGNVVKFVNTMTLADLTAAKTVNSILGTPKNASQKWATTARDSKHDRVLLQPGESLLLYDAGSAGAGEYDILIQYRIFNERTA